MATAVLSHMATRYHFTWQLHFHYTWQTIGDFTWQLRFHAYNVPSCLFSIDQHVKKQKQNAWSENGKSARWQISRNHMADSMEAA